MGGQPDSLSRYGFLYPQTDPDGSVPYDGSYGEQVERDLSVDGLPPGFLKDKSELDDRIAWGSVARHAIPARSSMREISTMWKAVRPMRT